MLHEICRPVLLIAPFDIVFSFTHNIFISGQSRENGAYEGEDKRGREDRETQERGRGPHRER